MNKSRSILVPSTSSELTYSTKRTLLNLLTSLSVNAAGVVTDEPFLTSSDKNLASTFDVNVKYLSCLHFDNTNAKVVPWILPRGTSMCECHGQKARARRYSTPGVRIINWIHCFHWQRSNPHCHGCPEHQCVCCF